MHTEETLRPLIGQTVVTKRPWSVVERAAYDPHPAMGEYESSQGLVVEILPESTVTMSSDATYTTVSTLTGPWLVFDDGFAVMVTEDTEIEYVEPDR